MRPRLAGLPSSGADACWSTGCSLRDAWTQGQSSVVLRCLGGRATDSVECVSTAKADVQLHGDGRGETEKRSESVWEVDERRKYSGLWETRHSILTWRRVDCEHQNSTMEPRNIETANGHESGGRALGEGAVMQLSGDYRVVSDYGRVLIGSKTIYCSPITVEPRVLSSSETWTIVQTLPAPDLSGLQVFRTDPLEWNVKALRHSCTHFHTVTSAACAVQVLRSRLCRPRQRVTGRNAISGPSKPCLVSCVRHSVAVGLLPR